MHDAAKQLKALAELIALEAIRMESAQKRFSERRDKRGYCVDDNARALLLSSALATFGEARLPEPMTARFAAFIHHAWNPDTYRFRNFMSHDRRWLEAGLGGQPRADALGLGGMRPQRYRSISPQWAAALFKTALPAVEHFRFPRAWAFTLLGLGRLLPGGGGRPDSKSHARTLGR